MCHREIFIIHFGKSNHGRYPNCWNQLVYPIHSNVWLQMSLNCRVWWLIKCLTKINYRETIERVNEVPQKLKSTQWRSQGLVSSFDSFRALRKRDFKTVLDWEAILNYFVLHIKALYARLQKDWIEVGDVWAFHSSQDYDYVWHSLWSLHLICHNQSNCYLLQWSLVLPSQLGVGAAAQR